MKKIEVFWAILFGLIAIMGVGMVIGTMIRGY